MPSFKRTDGDQILGDHERRISALERSPGRDPIFIDDRVIASPTSVVSFAIPSAGEILELTWQITVDATDEWLCFLFNADFPVTENDYRWRLFGDATADSDLGFNSAGAIGGPALTTSPITGPNWGRVRFPDWNNPGGDHGIIYQGEGGVYDGDLPHTWLIAGCGDPLTPLTDLHVFASASGGVPDGSKIIAPSRLTLTCY